MRKLAVVAFGGNALLRSGQKGTYQEQIQNVEDTCESLYNLLKRNYNIVIGHGNGPQVGNVMLQHEEGKRANVQAMPMDFCVAETQGSIAYLIEMGLRNVMARHDIQRDVVTLVTQVAVNKLDPMFQNPTKPVGPYYTKEQADELARTTGAVYKEDAKGRGWRKVVASPRPVRINNIKIVEELAKAGHIVVTVGGGGIPVTEESDRVTGVEAVIDKDLATSAPCRLAPTSSTSSPMSPRSISTSARRTRRRWTPSPSPRPGSTSPRVSLPKAAWPPRYAPPSCSSSTAARSASSPRPDSWATPTAARESSSNL